MDFDRTINRLNTASYKWDFMEKRFGTSDLVPFWVADMDFAAPPAVVEAIVERAKHGVYGYTIRPQSYYDAVLGWLERRHGWKIPQEWLTSCPTVMTSLSIVMEMLTEPGDGVILQSPVYNAFHRDIPLNDRKIVENPLRYENGRYTMDYEDLERKLAGGDAKLMLLCSPHNPVGRVWSPDELRQLGELCLRYEVPVVSDEIHFDLVYPGHKHTIFASLSDEIAQNSITLFAPTKTFNMAGLQMSNAVIPNQKWRQMFNHRLGALSLTLESYFALTAVEAAYTRSDQWLDELIQYLDDNRRFVIDFIREHLPGIEVVKSEGTYLLWLDCRNLGLNEQEIKSWMYQHAKVALLEGSMFGPVGEGFLRLNFACPRDLLKTGLERMRQAWPQVRK